MLCRLKNEKLNFILIVNRVMAREYDTRIRKYSRLLKIVLHIFKRSEIKKKYI